MFLNDILDKISERKEEGGVDDTTFIDPATGKPAVSEVDPIEAKLYDESYDPDEELNNRKPKENIATKFKDNLPSVDLSKYKKVIPLIILIVVILSFLGMNLNKITSATSSIKNEITQAQEEKEAKENEPDYIESIDSQGEDQKAYEDLAE